MKMKFSSVLKSMEEVSSAETAILLNIRDSKEYFTHGIVKIWKLVFLFANTQKA